MANARRICLVVTVVLALTVPMNGGDPSGTELDAWNGAVAAHYESLSIMPRGERMAALLQLPARMQEAIWILHAQHVLAAHPDLTPAQRSVIFERIGLLADGSIGKRLNGAAEEKAQAEEATGEVVGRARTLLPMHLVRDLFYEVRKPGTIAFPSRAAGRVRTNNTWCECSTQYGCDPFCESGAPLGCTPTMTGCGPDGMSGCDGTCIR